MNKLGKLIKESRKEKDLSQVALAQKLKMSPQFLNSIEAGRVGLPDKYWFKACDILEIPRVDLKQTLLTEYITFLNIFSGAISSHIYKPYHVHV